VNRYLVLTRIQMPLWPPARPRPVPGSKQNLLTAPHALDIIQKGRTPASCASDWSNASYQPRHGSALATKT